MGDKANSDMLRAAALSHKVPHSRLHSLSITGDILNTDCILKVGNYWQVSGKSLKMIGPMHDINQ